MTLCFSVIKVQVAIPIIYGCNIGTSVTSTLVSLGHMVNDCLEEFCVIKF